jgi:hypothetical protein
LTRLFHSVRVDLKLIELCSGISTLDATADARIDPSLDGTSATSVTLTHDKFVPDVSSSTVSTTTGVFRAREG